MDYLDTFRDPVAAKTLTEAIAQLCKEMDLNENQKIHIMEICGGHTHTIFRYGLDTLVPKNISFIHGPGCPVCVLPRKRIDECMEIAQQPKVIFTTFGDVMRVPGTKLSLQQGKALGMDVRMVYSPIDALSLARQHPEREVVFFGIGFETTTPATALSIQTAKQEGLKNFSVFCNHITVPPPIKVLLDDPDCIIDGFIGPGHVSMVIGTKPYDFIARDYGKPIVVAGFEPIDLLQSLFMVLKQIKENRSEVENQYARVVSEAGNPVAIAAVEDVYELRPSFEWRGLGEIERSGVKIRKHYQDYDAEVKFNIGYGVKDDFIEPEGCSCGEVMTGKMRPPQCKQFGKGCTPEMPLGALMVSSEGACAAYYQYGRTVKEPR